MIRKLGFFVLIIQILVASCTSNNQNNVIDKKLLPKVTVEVKRYGKALFELDTNNISQGLLKIKPKFKYFLDADLSDKQNLNQIEEFISDTALIHIYKKSLEVYPNNDYLNEQLTSGFQYLNYYYPKINLPQVYTYISGLQYEKPIWIQDSVMVIALDVYLGSDFEPYYGLGLPKYKIENMRPENLIVDVMKYFYHEDILVNSKQNTLLDRMIAGGKMLYFLDKVLPLCGDSLKINYTEKQLNWSKNNEKNIWAFLIENNLLYSTDYQSQSKLIQDGPFTTGFSHESPARLGIWLGWQIVRDYAKNNPETNLDALMKLNDSQELLHKSGYKP